MERIEITVRGIPPDEDLIYFVRRSWRASARKGACWVTIQRAGHQYRVDTWVKDDGASGEMHFQQEDPDAFLAVHNAFCFVAHAKDEKHRARLLHQSLALS